MVVAGPFLSPSHTFGTSLEGQAVEGAEDILVNILVLVAQQVAGPFCTIVGTTVIVEAVYIIGHRQEKVDGKLTRFDVASIQQPDAVGCQVVGFLQFLVHMVG